MLLPGTPLPAMEVALVGFSKEAKGDKEDDAVLVTIDVYPGSMPGDSTAPFPGVKSACVKRTSVSAMMMTTRMDAIDSKMGHDPPRQTLQATLPT